MKSIYELIDIEDSGIKVVNEMVAGAEHCVEILPPSKDRVEVLESLQVSTRSVLGAIAYETGGILIDNGWIRFFGSGHERLSRNLTDWNRSAHYLLVANDVVGGFFAINGGGLGADVGNIYYWSPDSIHWEGLEIGFADFFQWSATKRINEFYASLGKERFQKTYSLIATDKCLSFYPFLWAKEGSIEISSVKVVSVDEMYRLKLELLTSVS